MRLIDADKLVEEIWKLHKETEEQYDLCTDELKDVYCGVISLIDEQQTAYDADKIIEQLKHEEECSYADFREYGEQFGLTQDDDWYHTGLQRAINIVKAGKK